MQNLEEKELPARIYIYETKEEPRPHTRGFISIFAAADSEKEANRRGEEPITRARDDGRKEEEAKEEKREARERAHAQVVRRYAAVDDTSADGCRSFRDTDRFFSGSGVARVYHLLAFRVSQFDKKEERAAPGPHS